MGGALPKSLDFKLQRNSTDRLFCFVAHFNGKFAKICVADDILGKIKQRLSPGAHAAWSFAHSTPHGGTKPAGREHATTCAANRTTPTGGMASAVENANDLFPMRSCHDGCGSEKQL